ncbi:hypothetical protein L1887_02598 [Cichorium endivia]|nr:hypothetical protein L1887_02598 [Cichorium endivia]
MEARGMYSNGSVIIRWISRYGRVHYQMVDSLFGVGMKEAAIDPKLEGYSYTKSVLFPGISHVESLLIGVYFFSQCIKAASDPSLPNLKTLVLTTTIDAFTYDDFILILNYYPKVKSLKLVVKEEFYWPDEWELHEGDARKILSPDLKRVEFFEFNGEKPKLKSDWHEITILEMVFSWGIKVSFFY